MASTSLTLGPYWEAFIQLEIATGRYASSSEAVLDALGKLETQSRPREALRGHLDEGARQAANGEFVETSLQDIMRRAKKA
jgi:antitoxin ParD1/3/4